MLCEQRLEALLQRDLDLFEEVVRRSVAIKAGIVAADERDTGVRMQLNFGHTVGHAIEAAVGYGKLTHGEAVLAGMLAESHLAVSLGLLPEDAFARIRALISRFELEKRLRSVKVAELPQFVRSDKKNAGGKARVILPRAIGEVEVVEVDLPVLAESIAQVFPGR